MQIYCGLPGDVALPYVRGERVYRRLVDVPTRQSRSIKHQSRG